MWGDKRKDCIIDTKGKKSADSASNLIESL